MLAARRREVAARAATLGARGSAFLARGAFEDATLLLDSACLLAESSGVGAIVAESRLALGRAHNFVGNLDDAHTCFSLAAASFEEAGAAGSAIGARARLGFLAYERGDLDAAKAMLAPALDEADQLGAHAERGLVMGYLGNVARAERQLDLASAFYQGALGALNEAGLSPDARYLATFEMDTAITHLLRGDAVNARARLSVARELAEAAADQTVLELVGHYDFLAQALSGGGRDGPRSPSISGRRSAFLRDVRELAHATVWRAPARDLREDFAELRQRCPDYAHGRLGLSLLARLFGPSQPTARLVVGSDAAWARLDGGPVVELTEQRAPRLILLQLVRAAGTVVSADALIAAAWPGERMQAASARNRLHVALHALRRRGLGRAIDRAPGGWRLATPVEVVA